MVICFIIKQFNHLKLYFNYIYNIYYVYECIIVLYEAIIILNIICYSTLPKTIAFLKYMFLIATDNYCYDM